MSASIEQADTDADVRVVSAFVRRLRRVALHPLICDDNGDFVNELARGSFTLTPNGDGTVTLNYPLPDEVRFESLAARLRPFMVSTDDLFYGKAFDALGRLIGADHENYRDISNAVREEWRSATDRTSRTRAYYIVTTAEQYTDVDLAFSWLYGDLVHGDHAKVEQLNVMERFCAAVSVFSAVAVLSLVTLNLIKQLTDLGILTLPDGTFTDPVIVTESIFRFHCQAYEAEVGATLGDFESGGPLPSHFRPLREVSEEGHE